jgi:hypothetical protein
MLAGDAQAVASVGRANWEFGDGCGRHIRGIIVQTGVIPRVFLSDTRDFALES